MDPHTVDRLRAAADEIVSRPRVEPSGSARGRDRLDDPTSTPTRSRGGAGGKDADGPSAWDSALRLLGVRARSRSELRTRLLDKEFPPADVDRTLERLAEFGLLDDAEFARQWVESRHRTQGRGRIALRNELRTKGVDPAVAESALALVDDEDERARAEDLLARKVGSLTADDVADRGDRDRHTRRLVAMLARKGYPAGLAFDLVRSALDDLA
ncbi:regulatory protein RecX [Williamsia deligens]|uniref:Regulatory protein RecX n=1 Tax=Williamsia deligens TaxID=321325 RepID=A0ABW3GBI4_9NOCA|nr:regulatory protein RecX [Williamsia deligens]MCP2195444.1 regulatory protein [Williamsia deligens]